MNVLQISQTDLLNQSAAEQKRTIVAFLKTLAADMSKTDVSLIESSQHLSQLGLESIHMVDLKVKLDELIQLEIDVDEYMNNPTLAELADLAVRMLQEQNTTASTQSETSDQGESAADITSEPPLMDAKVEEFEQAPGPSRKNAAGDLFAFRKNPFEYMMNLNRRYGDIVRFHLGDYLLFLVADWESIKRILFHESHRYIKGKVYDPQRLLMGDGILTADHEAWSPQRRAFQPMLTKNQFSGFAESMAQHASRFFDEWDEKAATQEAFNLTPAMKRIVLGSIFEFLLDEPWGERSERLYGIIEYMDDFFQVPQEGIREKKNQNYLDSIERFHAIVNEIIDERMSEPRSRETIVSRVRDMGICEHADETQMRKYMLDASVSIIVAGFDTTSATMIWCCYQLASHPEIQDRVRAELDENMNRASVEEPPLLKAVILETLRLYPPLWFMAREAAADSELNGYFIPKGSFVLTSPYVVHRNAWHWPDPERFDPSRFLNRTESVMRIPHYFPFCLGPRACIGNHFALAELIEVLSKLLLRYRISLQNGEPVELRASFTLRPQKDPWFIFSKI